ncbi:hypothetical protein M3484_20340 [Pseudomonas sp. GX19020]|uniref:hypothetical protein n=1 Tax=Pseudomonas sp. GX19020 TaxID=2942277 RepID=UPI002018ED9F|nr:hypothetical protein [Pseudomonas sp. GX19020]MCL4068913.1 hypothetical protein [Pseudomonas sp. GX19020]
MTVAFNLTEFALPPRVVVGDISIARPGPLTVTCIGEVRHMEDDPALGPWWQQKTVTLGRCASIAEAISFISLAVARGDIAMEEGEALDFAPILFVILDRDKRLVLAGEMSGADVEWCDPVASDGEARQVVEAASRIRAEASYEAGWDNFSTAKGLRHKASVLEGRLVDHAWREEVRRILREGT